MQIIRTNEEAPFFSLDCFLDVFNENDIQLAALSQNFRGIFFNFVSSILFNFIGKDKVFHGLLSLYTLDPKMLQNSSLLVNKFIPSNPSG